MMTHFVIKRERYQRMMMRGIRENQRPLAQAVGVSKDKSLATTGISSMANLKI
jgi:hypothetical protein